MSLGDIVDLGQKDSGKGTTNSKSLCLEVCFLCLGNTGRLAERANEGQWREGPMRAIEKTGFYSLFTVKPRKDENRKFRQVSNSSSFYRS